MSKTITISDEVYQKLKDFRDVRKEERLNFKIDTDSSEKDMLEDARWKPETFDTAIDYLIEIFDYHGDVCMKEWENQ